MTSGDSDAPPTRIRTAIWRPRRISRRTLGKAMIAIGLAGILIGLTAAIAGQTMIRQVEKGVDDSLTLTGEGLAAVTDTIVVTESIVANVRTGMTSVRTTLTTVEASLADSSATLTQGGQFLGGPLPTALDTINSSLPTIQSIAKSVDDTLELLDEVPFGPNYQPVQPFDEAIGRLSTALTPLPQELRALSANFKDLNANAATMTADIARLGRDIEALNTKLADVGVLLDRYSDTASRAQALARESRADLTRSADLTRWLLIVLGVVFALTQVVPIWLGSVLLSSEGLGKTIVSHSPPGRERSPSTA